MAKPILDRFVILQAENGITGIYIKEYNLTNGDVHCAYNKITPEQAKTAVVISQTEGLDAVAAYWEYQFNQLPIDFQHLIKVIYPNIETADKMTLKAPFELLALAIAKAKTFTNQTCPLCHGRGWRYSGGSQLCYDCHGSGTTLPRITPELLDTLSKHFGGGANDGT